MQLPDILQLKYPGADFRKDIRLIDRGDGQGIVINEWNLPDPRPTPAQIAQWAIDYDLQYRQQQAVLKRKYPPINDQLDMMYNDKINNTTTWVDAVSAVKAANPKPTK